MKSDFPDFHPYSEVETVDIWSNSKIILDANVLLSAYGLTPDARNKLFEILSLIEDKLVMPYQVGLEFHRNRLNKVNSFLKANDRAKKELLDDLNKLKNKIKNHDQPFTLIKSNEVLCRNLISVLEESAELIKTKFEEVSGDQLSVDLRDIRKDFIYDTLASFFNGKINKRFDKSTLESIYLEGALRYSREVPPGFEDVKKPEPNRYGDLVIWKEIVHIANKNKKHIIFVTNDTKDDWWFNNNGKKEPRVELRQELRQETGLLFEMYTYTEFVRVSADRLSVTGTAQLEKQAEDFDIDTNEREEFIPEPEPGDLYIVQLNDQMRVALILEVFDDGSVLSLPISSRKAETSELKQYSIEINGVFYVVLWDFVSAVNRSNLIKYLETTSIETLSKFRRMTKMIDSVKTRAESLLEI